MYAAMYMARVNVPPPVPMRNKYDRSRKGMRPIRQQPSDEFRQNGYYTEAELAKAEIREWLELSIGVSNWSVGS